MSEQPDDMASSRRFAKVQKPRDSATLIIIRHDDMTPRVLLGQRHAGHAFMPNKYVFPGGRLDPADSRLRPRQDLHPQVLEKLTLRMRGRPSLARARALAVAAVRETFEEVGLIFGADAQAATSWRDIGARADLSSLRYFARAITPPGRTRRFDSRFFVADARHVGNLDKPVDPGTEELLTPRWFSFDEALELDLPIITRDMLQRLQPIAKAGGDLSPDHPVCFQYQIAGKWREDTL
jgi:8-oxo-dGTP pyrophosphatase MutT (NUDIX family)